LYDPAVGELAAGPTIRAWRPAIRGVCEVLHARFVEHAYPLHTHDAWTVFIVDEGAICYDLASRSRAADRPMVSLLPPHVAHDGRPSNSAGYRKRVLYLETPMLGEQLVGAAVDRPFLSDGLLRRRLSALHDLLGCPDELLEAETRLHFIVERLRFHLGQPGEGSPEPTTGELAERLRALLDERVFEQLTMADAAAALDASPTRLARSFQAAFGIPPHAYVTGRRLDAARARILEGEPLADVATAVGFFDQAHLTRRFRRYLGTTPGRYARAAQA
jgi:AraC-like DNA-binding protein